MTNVIIRDAKNCDYEYVMSAFRKAHGEIYALDDDLYVEEYPQTPHWKYSANIVLRDLFKAKARCLKIAAIDKQPVGAMFAETIPRNSWSAYKGHWRLDNIYVEKDYRRQGIAVLLIAAAQDWAKQAGYDYMDAKISARNEASQKLFEKIGCQGRHVLMEMSLKPHA